MAQLQMLYSEWLDQDLVVRIQIKSPPTIFSLASLVLEGTLAVNRLATLLEHVDLLVKYLQSEIFFKIQKMV